MEKLLKHCSICGVQLHRTSVSGWCDECTKMMDEEDERHMKRIQEAFAKENSPSKSFITKAGVPIDLSKVKQRNTWTLYSVGGTGGS